MKKIAVYATITPFGGGSFQYATSMVEALSQLNRSSYDIRVWYKHSSWEAVLKPLDIRGASLTPTVPAYMAKTLVKLQQLAEENALSPAQVQEFQALLSTLDPIRQLNDWQPDVCIQPQMGFQAICHGSVHIGVIHDLMHRYESRFPEVGNPEEAAKRDEYFQNTVSNCSAIFVDSEVGKQHVMESYNAADGQCKVLPFAAFNTM